LKRTFFHRKTWRAVIGRILIGIAPLLPQPGSSQILAVPPRSDSAPLGSEFINVISPMALTERENWIYAQVVSGNVPDFLRHLVAINVSGTVSGISHSVTYYVLPDYLSIGADWDYFLEPMTPLLAQRLCGVLGCTLPTRKMVDQIWTNAAVKLAPSPIPPSAQMTTVPIFAQHNADVGIQRARTTNAYPLGALVAGDKKDVIISTKIYTNFAQAGITKPVVIYGWQYQSGVAIQPLYNGHEETYADYSHGIRLVQDACLLDGAPSTVSSILTNAMLAALLSDEGTLEGTTNGVISKPRYTVTPQPSYLISSPRSQNAIAGSTFSLNAFAIGDMPIQYRWLFNGSVIPSVTSSNLVISNSKPSDAGLYSLIASNFSGSVTSRVAVVRIETNSYPLLFWDALDMDSSGQWKTVWGAANSLPDYTSEFAVRYGSLAFTFNGVTSLIPPAPHSTNGTSTGLKLTVNNGDTNGSIIGLNLYPAANSFSGSFALKFDLWINYPGNAGGINATGSTEYAIFGIDHTSDLVNWASASAAPSDGVWFGMDGDGGAGTDYRSYVGSATGPPLDQTSSPAGGLSASNHSSAIYQTLFPSARFETPGAPGKQWVSVEVSQASNVVKWLMDGTQVAQKTNTSIFTNGRVMIGMMDVFSSIANPARDAFVLYDNVRVEDRSGRLRILSISNSATLRPTITFSCFPGCFHNVEFSADLAHWQTAGVVFAESAPLVFVDSTANGLSPRFYRVRIP
jgi:hypothetical protein